MNRICSGPKDITSCVLMQVKKNRLLTMVTMSILILCLIVPIFAEVTNTKAALDRQMIRQNLESFDLQKAYDLLETFISEHDFESEPIEYLESLSELMLLEKRYGFYDKMVVHAIQLYKLSGDNQEYLRYKIIALDGLSYFDYYNYENPKMAIKLNEMQQLYFELTGDPEYSVYLEGLALLAFDERALEKSRTYLSQAISSLPTESSYDRSQLNLRASYKATIAETYAEEDDFESAVGELTGAVALLHQDDVEALTSINTRLAKYALKVGEVDIAANALQQAKAAYARTGDYFKTSFLQIRIDEVDGELAFARKNYKRAAEMFRNIFEYKADPDKVTDAIAAQEAASEFELEGVQEQLTLLEQLKQSQAKQLKLQGNILNTAFVAIGLMILLVVIILITLRWRTKQHDVMYQLSITDQLTQIFNRRKIMSSFEALKPGGKCIALLDLDRFKSVNDTYGHLVGDEVLRRTANTIYESIRENDEIGRYGGEEFLLILDTTSLDEANAIAERVRQNVEALEWEQPGLKTTISIGLVYSQTHYGDLLLTEADTMLYLAKEEGRNRVKAIEV